MTTRTATRTCGYLHIGPVAATYRLHTMDGRSIHACDLHAHQRGSEYTRAECLAVPGLTEAVPTSDLRTGQTVRFHGARLLIDRPVDVYPGRSGKPTVYQTQALISNYDDLAALAALTPDGTAATIVAKSADRRWLIQGTKATTWIREIPGRH